MQIMIFPSVYLFPILNAYKSVLHSSILMKNTRIVLKQTEHQPRNLYFTTVILHSDNKNNKYYASIANTTLTHQGFAKHYS